MNKVILLTGATDGIGFETAKLLAAEGHTLLLHGRNSTKLDAVKGQLATISGVGELHTYQADLSDLNEVMQLVNRIASQHSHIDVLINNAGVFKTPSPLVSDQYDVRFIVNTVAPYLLTTKLLSLMPADGRVVNLSSAAQASVDVQALTSGRRLADGEAYAQSKLGITMWSFYLAQLHGAQGPAVVAINPASFLGSKMVKEAYGTAGNDLSIGANMLFRAALSDEFNNATGRYYDNDRGQFATPHPDAMNPTLNKQLVEEIDTLITTLIS